jgi:multidrug transporter EmrE-like cation transporter
MIGWILLGLAVSGNVAASVFLKYAAIDRAAHPGLLQAALDWRLLAAIGAYFVSFVFYASSMSRLPLTVAQPVLTVGVLAGVGVAAAVMFHEHVTPIKMAAYGLILVALALFAWSGVADVNH